MASRKAWDELTPAYRARLQRAGVTEAKHAAGVPITDAVGHGLHLRSGAARLARAQQRLSAREAALGYVKPDLLRLAINEHGAERVSVLIDWQEKRREDWRAGIDPVTLEQFITSEYGEEYWEDFAPWYDELDPSWSYYH